MAEITNTYILEKLQQHFGADVLASEESYGMLSVTFNKERNVDVIKFLRDDSELQFNFLTDLCAVHYPDNVGNELSMVYHMHSFYTNIRIRLKFFIPISHPHIATITGLYEAANWQERETFDFYGVVFDGHPNLKRIVNVDEMDYFPQRREYPLEDGTRRDKADEYFGR